MHHALSSIFHILLFYIKAILMTIPMSSFILLCHFIICCSAIHIFYFVSILYHMGMTSIIRYSYTCILISVYLYDIMANLLIDHDFVCILFILKRYLVRLSFWGKVERKLIFPENRYSDLTSRHNQNCLYTNIAPQPLRQSHLRPHGLTPHGLSQHSHPHIDLTPLIHTHTCTATSAISLTGSSTLPFMFDIWCTPHTWLIAIPVTLLNIFIYQ
jgi:hypothetical protein